MKKIIFNLLLCLTVLSNDLFVYDFNGTVALQEVENNKVKEIPFKPGQSFSLTNNLSIKNDTNGIVSYITPHRIGFTQVESTDVYFNGDIITYKNNFNLPEIVKIEDSSFTLSLMGQLYVVSEHTKQSTIGTSMGNIVYEKAKFFVKAGEKYTHVYAVEGKITVLDTKSSKKKELKVGDYLVITPQVNLSPRSNIGITSGNSFSIKEVEDLEKDIHLKELEKLNNKLDNVLFINYSKSIFGIKLKLQ